jgi:hypothetical protein
MLSWVVAVVVVLVAAYLWAAMASTSNKLESPEPVPVMLRYLLDRGIDTVCRRGCGQPDVAEARLAFNALKKDMLGAA